MTYQFTADELTNMRLDQEGHMLDTGNIQRRIQTKDSFAQSIETFPTNDTDMACGLDMRPGSERFNVEATITNYDATVRIPITATPTVGDRFRVTKRFGETLSTALVYDIAAPIQQGPSGLRLALMRIET